jgi:hypothetical protein
VHAASITLEGLADVVTATAWKAAEPERVLEVQLLSLPLDLDLVGFEAG